MIDNITKERRIQSNKMIESLIASRTETLTQYKQLMTYQPFEMNEILQEVLEDFCEVLVDYTAKAHFKLYDSIENKTERRESVLDIADNIYPLLLENTQKILDFHDQYSSDVSRLSYENLESCLNDIGELLADRISLEDDVFNAILSPESV